jgi:hypothetical protein
MCHSNFPRLNDYGWRYRLNGYQLPGQEDNEKTVLESGAPFAARTSAGYNYDKFENTPDAEDVNQFQINGLDLLSAGVLGRNMSYLVVYPPHISASSGVVGQEGTLESANLVFANLGGSRWLNVRAGRFEPLYVAFSSKRALSVSPYEIYDFSPPRGVAFSDNQDGIEVYGWGRNGFEYAAGWLNGSGTNKQSDTASDFYVRAAKVFGRGEGWTVGQRVGLVGYWGKARPEGQPEAERQSLSRYGIDASLNYGHCNLALEWLKGNDDRSLWADAPADVDWRGGFAELTYMPAYDHVGFLRYDKVDTPAWANADVSRWTIGWRYYPQDQLALHLEWSRRTQDAGPEGGCSATERFLTARLDFAF